MGEYKELYHYGVIGMKWGIRKDKYRAGHTIKKGTMMYRASVNKSENLKGPTYVTYLPVDRDHYRGAWADSIRKNGNSSELYEHRFKLKEDLKIPSREEVMEVTNKFRNDKQVIKDNVEMQKKHMQLPYELRKLCSEIDSPGTTDAKTERFINNLLKISKSNQQLSDSLDKEAARRAEQWAKEQIKNYGKRPLSEVYRETTQSLGESPKTKEKIINELKRRGYNAMVDEASVGGYSGFKREGVEPLIIFDSTNSLDPGKSKKVSKRAEKVADYRYGEWFRLVNPPGQPSKNDGTNW